MKYRLLLVIVIALFSGSSIAQKIDDIITAAEVTRVESTLSSDAMEGRRTFTKGIDKAAAFLAEEFAKMGLQPGGSNNTFLQSFDMISARIRQAKVLINGQEIPSADIICQTTMPMVHFQSGGDAEIVHIGATDNFMQMYRSIRGKSNNLVVFIDTAHRNFFNRVKAFGGPRFPGKTSQLLVLTPAGKPEQFSAHLDMELTTHKLANVVGIIPGRSKASEVVIFSGHYDHLGYGKPDDKGDSLYNGANDDASGTTAVVMLARYFKALGPQERTLVFAAFTAEEVGGFGSQYFSRQYDAARVMAMFNIEMIGTESKWGRNSAYITGYEKTDMGKILEKNLQGTSFSFYPDPYPQQNLFYRSDNATLARLGVPAHTISTSKMDSEPHYHKPSDEIGTLDMQNMAEVIKAIALSSRSIVSGQDTPTRVNTAELR